MKVSTVSVFLDYKCNFACDHCSVGSSPETEFELPDTYLGQVFRQAPDLPNLKLFVFTGGEVTLHWETLLEAISRASALGYRTRIVTNGWWAYDMENARQTVQELVDAGLDELNTSYDDFHTDYVEVDRTVNLVEAALESDIKQTSVAMIVGNEDPEYDLDRMIELLDDRLDEHPDNYEDELTLLEDTAAPMGSGAQLDVSELSARNAVDSGCSDVMNTVSLHPDGTIKACCGHAQWYVPDLTIGSLDEDTLPEIVERAQHNLVYWLIHEVGPKPLLERLGYDNHHSGVCHACHDLLGNHREEFLEYVRENREQLVTEDLFLGDDIESKADTIMENRDAIVERLSELEEEKSDVVQA